jgi:hypothetical protein
MAKFRIQLQDGRSVRVDAPNAQEAAEGADQWAQANPKPGGSDPVTRKSVTVDEMRKFAGGPTNPLSALAGFVSRGGGDKAPANFVRGAIDQAVGTVADTVMNAGAALGGNRNAAGPQSKGFLQLPRGVIDTGEAAVDAVSKVIPGGNMLSTVAPRVLNRTMPSVAPQNLGERILRVGGQAAAGAAAPGSIIQKVKNVAFPTAGGAIAGEVAKAAGADERGQAVAQTIGAGAGGVLANVSADPRLPPEENALGKFAQKAKPDAARMRARAQEYRDVGIEPTLVDVTDESGRGVVRANASRMTAGREVAQDFGDKRALDLPDRMGKQARRVMSSDPRTPDQIAAQLAKARGAAADKAFGNVRYDPVEIDPADLTVLKVPDVKSAVMDAVRRERDSTDRAALAQVLEYASGGRKRPPGMTVGMVDRISRVLLSKAQGLRATDPDLAATLSKYGNTLRDAAKSQSTGYADALKGYAAQSKLIEGAGRGEDFLKRNTDEFVADAAAMSPQERALARATGRRAVERASGESVGSAPGVAGRLAEAPEQRARNRALLGNEDAARLEQGMRLEERAVRNARDIAPRTGSQTQNKAQDALDTAGGAVRVVGRGGRGDLIGATVEAANMWLKRQGFSEKEAEELVRIATDPGQTNRVLSVLESRVGRNATIEWAKGIGPRLLGAGQTPAAASAAAIATSANSRGTQERRTQGR